MIVYIVAWSIWIMFRFDKLWDIIEIVLIKVGILFVDCLSLLLLLTEIIHRGYLLLLCPISLSLELLHKLYLISQSLSPEFLSFIVLHFPIRQLLLNFTNVLIMSVMNSQIILFFLFQHTQLSLCLQFRHLVVW